MCTHVRKSELERERKSELEKPEGRRRPLRRRAVERSTETIGRRYYLLLKGEKKHPPP